MTTLHTEESTREWLDRIEKLEIQLSFADDLLDTLNLLVTRQQHQIELLQHEVAELRQLRNSDNPPAFRSLRDELPPHY
jgi:SlyX protein